MRDNKYVTSRAFDQLVAETATPAPSPQTILAQQSSVVASSSLQASVSTSVTAVKTMTAAEECRRSVN